MQEDPDLHAAADAGRHRRGEAHPHHGQDGREPAEDRLLAEWLAGRREPFAVDVLIDLLIDAARTDEALLVTRAAAESGGARARARLGRTLLLCGRAGEAVRELREAAYGDPGDRGVLTDLGRALIALGDYPDAVATLQRALRVAPGDAEASSLLGDAWMALGMAEKAQACFRTALATDPEDGAGAALRLAQINAAPPPERAPPAYVRCLFDQYAPTFERDLSETLDYRGPSLIADAAAKVVGGRHALSVLDLGCGTGLCGRRFRAIASRLVGVDLSPGMLAIAAASGLYDTLHATDIETFLAVTEERFDLVVASDVLNYLGDLGPVTAGVARLLAADGAFLLTVEQGEGDGWRLSPSRRFVHGPDYLRHVAAAAGLRVAALETDQVIRREARRPVPAIVATLTPA